MKPNSMDIVTVKQMTILHSFALSQKCFMNKQKLLPFLKGDNLEFNGVCLLQFAEPDGRVISLPIQTEESSNVKSRFQTKMMYFDVFRSFFREGNDDKYMVIAQAELNPEFLNSKSSSNFTEDDKAQLLNETIVNLLNLVELDFKSLLFLEKLTTDKINCFKPQESLKGLTIADLYIRDPKNLK